MGKNFGKRDLHEIADTKAAARDEAFEEILERIKSSGAKMSKDETSPLYLDIGMEEFETGTQRIVEFSIGRNDFQITRNEETHILQGSGKKKHVEELDTPRIKITLKRKDSFSNDWQMVDIEDVF